MKNLLFVDDEKNILQSLKRSFYKKRDQWNMTFVSSGKEALLFLADNDVDIVVTDMKMPEMTGVELLEIIQKKYSGVIRIALSGHADQDLLIESIGLYHQYYTKPCDLQTLEEGITEAFDLYNILRDKTARDLINGSKNLPILPAVYNDLRKALIDPECSISDLSLIIERDISLTANLLNFINTPFFGLRSNITNIKQAVTLLGIDIIKSMVLTIDVFRRSHVIIDKFDLNRLMDHSVRVANYARIIAHHEGVKQSDLDMFFVTGILHDIGKVVLYNNYEVEYGNVINKIDKSLTTIQQAENSLMGVNHSHIGAYLLGLWGFDKEIVYAVANHHGHTTDIKRDSLLLQILHSVNLIDHQLVIINDNFVPREIDETILNDLSIIDKYNEWSDVIRKFIESQ
ncbi:MAG: hypothetical protein C0603_03850 [Denitrovibrio sp.]|nr:MAG: hypothetical protein C0603_03850 [Denitrovibrio sp.]